MSSVNPPRLPDPEDASTRDLMVMTGSIFVLVVFLILFRYVFIILLDTVCLRTSVEQPWQAFLRRYCLCLRRENSREEQGSESDVNGNIRNVGSQSLAYSLTCLPVEKRNALLDIITPRKVITEEMVSKWTEPGSDNGISSKPNRCSATHTKDEESVHEAEKCEGESTCVICISPYEVGDICAKTRNCSHVFHRECISQWLQKSVECPYCRTELVSKEEIRDIILKFANDEKV